jgi:hypothetical protein
MIDSFDDGLSSQKWTTLSGPFGVGPNVTYARTGPKSCFVGDWANVYRQLSVGEKHATMIAGAAFRFVSNYNVFCYRFRGDNAATDHVNVKHTTDQRLQIYRGGTLLDQTAPNLVAFNVWHYIETKTALADAGGRIVVRLNGLTVLDFTGDTKNGGTDTSIDSIYIGEGTGNTSGQGFYFDDYYMLNGAGAVNNDLLGDCCVYALFPNGNGNYSQWVGSDGNSTDNYLLVDENPDPNTSDYVENSTAGNKDSYPMSDLPGTVTGVQGVIARAYASKSDAGAQVMRQFARVSGTDYAGADFAPSQGSYNTFSEIWELNPATSALWTPAQLNGAEFGIEGR